MKFIQLLLTDEQTELTAAALRDAEEALKDERADRGGVEVTSEDATENERLSADIAAVGRLMLLFQDASENPAKYPPTGKMAATVRSIARRAKGTPQPASRRRRRADRHQRRRALRNAFRRNRAFTEGYNRAYAIQEQEEQEYQAALAEIQERVKDQPKYAITDGFGNTIMAGVPAEFVLDAEGLPLDSPKGKIVLPPSATRVDL